MNLSHLKALELAVALNPKSSIESFLALGVCLLSSVYGKEALEKAQTVIDTLPEGTSPVGVLHALEEAMQKQQEVH